MSEWEGCPNFNNEKSGTTLYCNLIGTSPGDQFYGAYCSAKSTEDQSVCPYLGGDNHVCNPDCLTEEMCRSIYSSVKSNIDCAQEYIAEFLLELNERAGQTGYDALTQQIRDAEYQPIAVPSMGGEIASAVETEPERERAATLESELNGIFSGLDVGSMAAGIGISTGSSLVVDSDDFEAMADFANTQSTGIGETICGQVDAVSRYSSIMEGKEEELSDGVYEWFSGIIHAITETQAVFESGVSSTLGQMRHGGTSYSGNLPRWDD